MTNLVDIKGFSKPLISNLQKLGISNIQSLLLHLPLRYIDETRITQYVTYAWVMMYSARAKLCMLRLPISHAKP
jgi:RecG-like helicase